MPKIINKSVLILILIALLSVSCIQKVERASRIDSSRYFPLNVGDEYIFSGAVRKIVTTNNIENLFTRAYLDSTGDLLRWEDVIKTENGIKLKSRSSVSENIPAIHFEPPLPYAPWANLIGDTLLFNAVEIRDDSINSHLRVQIRYEIMAIETVVVPAGIFEDCIKVRMFYRTLDDTESIFFDGESIFWYCRDIGIIRFMVPEETGELLQLTVAGKIMP